MEEKDSKDINIVNDKKDNFVHKQAFNYEIFLKKLQSGELKNKIYSGSIKVQNKSNKTFYKKTKLGQFLGEGKLGQNRRRAVFYSLKGIEKILKGELKSKEDFELKRIEIIGHLHKALAALASSIDEIDGTKYEKGSVEQELVNFIEELQQIYQFFVYSDFDLTNLKDENNEKKNNIDLKNDEEKLTFHKSLEKGKVKVSCLEYEVPRDNSEGAEGNINKIYFANFADSTKVVIKEDPFVVWKRNGAAGRQDKEQGLKNIADNISKQLFQQTIEEMIFGIGNTRYIAKTKPVLLKREDESTQWATLMENVQKEDEGQFQGVRYLLYSTEKEREKIVDYLKEKGCLGVYEPRKIDYKLIAQSLDMGVNDFISGQRDRHCGNWTLNKSGGLKAIDNDRIQGIDMSVSDDEQMLNEKVPFVTARTALQTLLLVKNYRTYRDRLNIQCGFNQHDNYEFGSDNKSESLDGTEKRIVMLYNRSFGTNFKLNDLDSIGDKSKTCEIEKHADNLYSKMKKYLEDDYRSPNSKLASINGENKYKVKNVSDYVNLDRVNVDGEIELNTQYEMSDNGFEEFIKDCLEIPEPNNDSDKSRFALLIDYFNRNIDKNKTEVINDYQLAEDCSKNEKELKRYVDKFLKPKHVSVISKICSWFGKKFGDLGKALDALRTRKKGNIISSAHGLKTVIPLQRYHKGKSTKKFEERCLKNNPQLKSNKYKNMNQNIVNVSANENKIIRLNSLNEFLNKYPVPIVGKKNANEFNHVNSEKDLGLTGSRNQPFMRQQNR